MRSAPNATRGRCMKQYTDEKSESKKLVPLYLIELFTQRTDKNHYIEIKDIISFLRQKKIFVDRRTIYAAISILNSTGFEIESIKGNGKCKYYLSKRAFTTAELKFLVDAIAASRFLTETKSKELIDKVKAMASDFDNELLNRNTLLSNRVKSMDETIQVFNNLDQLHKAINNNNQITFQYYHYQTDKKLYASDKKYIVSPYAVSLNNDNYYMIAFDSASQSLRHYRIDKMKYIRITDVAREGAEHFKGFNIAEYSKKTFNMYKGTENTVTFACDNSLVGVFIDRFGKDVSIRPDINNDKQFIVHANINVSPQFFGWVCGLGKSITILSPQSVIEDFKNFLTDIQMNYVPK